MTGPSPTPIVGSWVHASSARSHNGDAEGVQGKGRKPSTSGIFQSQFNGKMGTDSRPLSLIMVSYFYINPPSRPASLVKLNVLQMQEGEAAHHSRVGASLELEP